MEMEFNDIKLPKAMEPTQIRSPGSGLVEGQGTQREEAWQEEWRGGLAQVMQGLEWSCQEALAECLKSF